MPALSRRPIAISSDCTSKSFCRIFELCLASSDVTAASSANVALRNAAALGSCGSARPSLRAGESRRPPGPADGGSAGTGTDKGASSSTSPCRPVRIELEPARPGTHVDRILARSSPARGMPSSCEISEASAPALVDAAVESALTVTSHRRFCRSVRNASERSGLTSCPASASLKAPLNHCSAIMSTIARSAKWSSLNTISTALLRKNSPAISGSHRRSRKMLWHCDHSAMRVNSISHSDDLRNSATWKLTSLSVTSCGGKPCSDANSRATSNCCRSSSSSTSAPGSIVTGHSSRAASITLSVRSILR
eukprot:Unigene10327_Nuclearia_a/m.31548 Unigene10327_Nuclearia_a/g.31548  ORF Unigene10327_Nuclearia_a/g.31548 Unigene10327_Nuclearia_a/m.31548 type:complete len:308 (+) Unigene10327_Nuclearia_a:2003-2926(+)